jgi:hypothetical protein
MSYVLTLHVEEKGGQRRNHKIPFLITQSHDWLERGSGEKKENRTDTGLGCTILSSAQRKDMSYTLQKSWPQPSSGRVVCCPPPPQERRLIKVVLSPSGKGYNTQPKEEMLE